MINSVGVGLHSEHCVHEFDFAIHDTYLAHLALHRVSMAYPGFFCRRWSEEQNFANG